MSRRKRVWVIGLALLGAFVALEIGLNLWKGREACVLITNEGLEPVENLMASTGAGRFSAPSLAPGASARVYFAGRGASTLRLSFRQRGNAMTSFDHPGFDPDMLRREDSRLVIRIRPNEVERFQEAAEPSTPFGQVYRQVRDIVASEFPEELP